MKTPSPEVAYLMALVALQKSRVEDVKREMARDIRLLQERLSAAQFQLEYLQRGLTRTKKDVKAAKEYARMPWLKDRS